MSTEPELQSCRFVEPGCYEVAARDFRGSIWSLSVKLRNTTGIPRWEVAAAQRTAPATRGGIEVKPSGVPQAIAALAIRAAQVAADG